MEDKRIIELYFARDERAIEETKISYGRLIFSVARAILGSDGDSEECENDTYLGAWNSIPPTVPTYLSAYLSRIARNLALNRLRSDKRRLSADMIIDEIGEAIPDVTGDITEDIEIRDALNEFLMSLSKTKRQIFVKRYFFMKEVKVIAKELGVSVGSVKVTLSRLRAELRRYLEERGIVI